MVSDPVEPIVEYLTVREMIGPPGVCCAVTV